MQNALPEIMGGLRELFGLEEGGSKKSVSGGKTSAKPEKATSMDISGSESENEAPVARDPNADMDIDMEGEGSDEDYAQFDARLAPDSEDESEDNDDNQQLTKPNPPPRSSMSISLSPSPSSSPSQEPSQTNSNPPTPSPSRSPSPPPKKAKPQSKTKTKTPPSSTTFLPSLMMGGYWSGSEEEASEPEDADEHPRRKNRMGQQARRALWEKKFGAGANHVKGQGQKENGKGGTKKAGRGKNRAMDGDGRDSGWDLRKGATFTSESGERGKLGTGSNAMAMVGDSKVGRGRGSAGEKKAQGKDEAGGKPLHPSWEAAKKAKESKSTASFQGKKVVFD